MSEPRIIRGLHPGCFRSGEWASLVGEVEHTRGRRCYVVRFPDGTSDFWPVEASGYEYGIKGAS